MLYVALFCVGSLTKEDSLHCNIKQKELIIREFQFRVNREENLSSCVFGETSPQLLTLPIIIVSQICHCSIFHFGFLLPFPYYVTAFPA